jgi:hypothetical protein
MATEPKREEHEAVSGMGRLLPWTTEEGKPCYLTSASEGGFISRMADTMEAEQIRTGREVLAQARGLMEQPSLGKLELRFVAARLTECLSDSLRIAESRGIRLGVEDPRPDDEVEELEDSEAEG